MKLTMDDWCLNCGKKQGINESYIYYELEEGHITFCGEECEKEYKNKLRNSQPQNPTGAEDENTNIK